MRQIRMLYKWAVVQKTTRRYKKARNPLELRAFLAEVQEL
jgi:hypothetical protein